MPTNPTHKDDVSDALALLGELLDGPSKGAFYGIDASLRSKLETIRLTLNRAQPGGLVEAAVNQNDAMRQELAHIGNLVSDLARAMRVDQANDDGSWPDLAGGIDKLKQAALASSDSPAIPAGMKPWHGGDHAPDDWDGGEVLLGCGQMGDGNVWDHHPSRKPGHIIAYTPKPTPTDTADRREAIARAIFKNAGHRFMRVSECYPIADAILDLIAQSAPDRWPNDAKFALDDRVTTLRRPYWVGKVCGWYRNSDGRLGFAVEADAIPGAIHVYPEAALAAAPKPGEQG